MNFHKIQHSVFRIVFFIYSYVAPLLATFLKIPPLRLTAILTNKCNLSCANCYEKDQLNKPIKGELTLDEWTKIIQSLSRFTILDLVGGEIFLFKNLSQILSLCAKKSIFVSLTTNATLLNKDNIQNIFDFKIHYLMISVDGLGVTHDRYRGKQNHFEQIVETLKLLIEKKKQKKLVRPFICIKFLIMNNNIHEMIDFIKYFEKLDGIDEIKFNFVTQKKYWNELVAFENLEEVFVCSRDKYQFSKNSVEIFKNNLPFLKKMIKNSKVHIGFQPQLPNIENYIEFLQSKENFKTGVCYIPRSNFTILSNGEIIPCLSYKLGNIREFNYDVNKVLFNPLHLNFIKRQSTDFTGHACRGCVTKPHTKAIN